MDGPGSTVARERAVRMDLEREVEEWRRARTRNSPTDGPGCCSGEGAVANPAKIRRA